MTYQKWYNYCTGNYELWRPILGKPSYYTCRDCHTVHLTHKRRCPYCGSVRNTPNYPLIFVEKESL